jgi:hypothetical protein
LAFRLRTRIIPAGELVLHVSEKAKPAAKAAGFLLADLAVRAEKYRVFTNVVDLSKKRCFHGGAGIDNEVICSGYIEGAV